MKKTITIVIVLGVILGGIALFYPSKIEVKNPEPQTVVETEFVEKERLDSLIETALTASSTAIEAEAQEAYNDAKKKAETEIKLRVTSEYRKEIEAREAALEEQVSF